MQVGAVSDGGKGKKGKSKSTGDNGKGKGKGKDKNKRKSNDEDKAKGRDYWNSGQQQAQFQSYCSHCSKWGHKRADCRTRLAQQKNGAVAGVQETESEAGDVKAAQWSDIDSEAVDMDSSSWCFGALSSPRGPAGTLLVDCGADDHICHPDFAKEFPMKNGAGMTLRDVQGNPLSHHSTRHVNLSEQTLTSRLFLHQNSLRIRANPIVHHVSPVMEDDMPVRLSGQSPLRLLDRRLESWRYPSTARCWTSGHVLRNARTS